MKHPKYLIVIAICLITIFATPSMALAYSSFIDSTDNTIYHYFSRTITKWDTADIYEFIKQVPQDGNASYWITIGVVKGHKGKKTAEITIDDKTYILNAPDDPIRTKYARYVFSRWTYLAYDIPDEVIDAIKKSTSPITIIVPFESRPALVWKFDEKQTQQIKDMISTGRTLK